MLSGTALAIVLTGCGLTLTGMGIAGTFADSGQGSPAGGGLGAPGTAALHHDQPSTSPASSPSGQPAGSAASANELRTSCTSVAHIGDSTSVGMVSALYLPDAGQRLAAQYARVGVRKVLINASGGRSIVETLPGQVNGYNVALHWADQGYKGCWVIALGTNDTANVSVGSTVSRMARIEEMMSVAHGEPVLWVNTWTLLDSGPWSQANMKIWNATLLQACAKYPNLRIFDWAAVVQPQWFLSDGIHYTSDGYAARARLIADALAHAFPYNGQSHTCVVR